MDNFILNWKQHHAAFEQKNPTFAVIGGVSAGKSITGSYFSLNNVVYRPIDEVGFIFANTHKQLNTATLRVFKRVLFGNGYFEDAHYVTHKDPKPYFGYDSKFDKHDGIWSFHNGCQIYTFSLEGTFEGIEGGWAWGDEIQTAQKEQLDVLFARMRGSKNPQTLFTLTPPDGNKYIENLIWGENAIPSITTTTYDNEHNLPAGFIEGLKNTYDRLTFDRQVLAKQVAAVTNRWVYALDDEAVINRVFVKGLAHKKGLPIYLSFDFNKDPLTCLAIQRFQIGPIRAINVLREFRLSNSNIDNLCARIQGIYGWSNYYITGDSTGKDSDSPVQTQFINHYQKIGMLLRVPSGNFNVCTKNPFHTKSRDQVNSIVQNNTQLFIDDRECPMLKDDMLYVKSTEDGKIDKTKDVRQTHLLDCFRYDLHVYEWDYLSYYKPKFTTIQAPSL